MARFRRTRRLRVWKFRRLGFRVRLIDKKQRTLKPKADPETPRIDLPWLARQAACAGDLELCKATGRVSGVWGSTIGILVIGVYRVGFGV